MLRRLVSLTFLKLEELRFGKLKSSCRLRAIICDIPIFFPPLNMSYILGRITDFKLAGYICYGMGDRILPKGPNLTLVLSYLVYFFC